MTTDERAQVQEALDRTPSLRTEIGLLLSPWATMIFVFMFLWAISAGLGKLLLKVDFGWRSPWGSWIFVAGIVLCTSVIAVDGARRSRRKKRSRRSLEADLAAAVVEELNLRLIGAKRFQEPEHGGLIYFLLTDDNKVFVQFDYESQDLGVARKDPMKSAYRPRSAISLVRAPASRLILSQASSGDLLELGAPIPLTVKPSLWPDSEEYSDTRWEDLEATYGA